jgi:large subunit ribosomal protein L30
MAKKADAPKILRVTLIKSVIGYPQRQKDTVKALGLHRINQTVEQKDSAVIRGMISKVNHLVSIEE